MENVRLLDFLIFAFSGLLGWVARVMWDDMKQMRRDLSDLEKGLPKEYVRKADWDRATDRLIVEIKEFRKEMSEQFDSIWRELKGKQDKPNGNGHD